jgi:hypothetical protein
VTGVVSLVAASGDEHWRSGLASDLFAPTYAVISVSGDDGKRSQVNELAPPLRASPDEALREVAKHPIHAARRLACYHKVVQVVVRHHGIGGDDPGEAMRRVLRRLEDVGEAGGCDEQRVSGQAREGIGEVCEA